MFEYEKDTLIETKVTKVIKYKFVEIQGPFPEIGEEYAYRIPKIHPKLYLRESNDSIFSYYEDEFKYIYKFNAELNDTIICNQSGFSPRNFTTDPFFPQLSVSDTNIVNLITTRVFSNRQFDVFRTTNSGRWEVGDLINKTGGKASMLPLPTLFNNGILYQSSGSGDLIYYRDDLRGVLEIEPTKIYDINTIDGEAPIIDFILNTNSTSITDDTFNLYPNPVDQTLFISNIDQIKSYTIYDVTGKVWKVENNPNTEIDVKELPSGFYYIQFQNDTKNYSLKFLKQ